MKKSYKIVFGVTVIFILLILGTGCFMLYRKGTVQKESVPKNGQIMQKASTCPTATVIPDLSVSDWSIAKQSGRKGDFEAYFKKDLNAYTKERNVPKGKMKIHYDSKVIGEKREVYIYTPPNYSMDKKYPVLYLLHGIGCDGSQWISMKTDIVLDNMIADGEVVPCVVVCPSIAPKKNKRTKHPNGGHSYEVWINGLVNFLQRIF